MRRAPRWPGKTMSGIDDGYGWPIDDVVLPSREMTAIRRVDQAHVAIRERVWPDGDAEVVLLFEDLPRVIERLRALHAEWLAQQRGEPTFLPAGATESPADEGGGR